MMSAAKSVAKKKFGYQRSKNLTTARQKLHFLKAILSSTAQNMKPTEKIVKRAVALDIDFKGTKTLNKRQVQKQITAARQDLWLVQKKCD